MHQRDPTDLPQQPDQPLRRLALHRLGIVWGLASRSDVRAAEPMRKLERTQITIAVGGKSLLYFLPLTLAEQLGYFKAEGLQVDVVDYAGAAKALQAVQAGNADIVSGTFEHTISMHFKHRSMRAFVLQGRTPQIVVGVSRKTLPNYREVGDLRGRRIGITAAGSTTHLVVQTLLDKAGLAPSDVTLLPVGASSAAVNAVRTGQIDALANLDPVIAILQRDAELNVIADLRTVKDTLDLFGGPMPGACLYAPAEFLAAHRHTVQAVTRAMLRALRWMQKAGPSDLVRVVPEPYLLGDRALYLDAWLRAKASYSPDGLLSESAARTALRALQAFNPGLRGFMSRGKSFDLTQTYTNDYVKAVTDIP